ncbi:hypothetical protein BH11PSE10_BH11PSE10_09210 [soil metagenome]
MIRFRTTVLLSIRAGVVLVACALTGGCAVTPQVRQSLNDYVSASEQVRQTAGDLVTDYENFSKAHLARKQPAAAAAGPSAEYPGVFDPAAVFIKPALTDSEKAIAETRQALLVVHDYSALLVALVEGRSEAEVRQQTESLGGTLRELASIGGLVIPGVTQFAGLASKFIKLAQDAANRELLLVAVDEGREPMRLILQGLKDQTPGIYGVSLDETRSKQRALREAIQALAISLAKLCSLNGPPVEAAVATTMAEMQVQAGEVAGQTRTAPAFKIPFPFVAGKAPADSAVAAQAEVFVQGMRVHAQRYGELVAAQNAYYGVLSKYIRTLDATQASFKALVTSLTAPVDPRAEIRRLLGAGFELRDAFAAYRNPTLAPGKP